MFVHQKYIFVNHESLIKGEEGWSTGIKILGLRDWEGKFLGGSNIERTDSEK